MTRKQSQQHDAQRKPSWRVRWKTMSRAVGMEIREHKSSFAVYVVLRMLVLAMAILQFFNGDYENVFLCILTLVLFTLPTVIETPDAWESQSPGQEAPFSLCDVWVECPGYQLLLVQNVQIFSGVTSIQDLPLIPLAETTGRPASRVDITPQNL